ncbi:MAG: tripartite tricarboxylate transporter substrate binding protein [Pseudomonadota bacterium]
MRHFLLALFLALPFCAGASAQTYPSRPITLIVPFAPGSGTDSVARVVMHRLSEILRTPIVVDNRAGANGAIGAAFAARATPDGYTLMIGGVSTHAANPSLIKSIQYDPKDDFVPISQLGVFPYFLIVYPQVPAESVKELVEVAAAKPGSLSFAYGNAIGQLAGEMLKKRTGTELLAVPYKSSPQGVTDLMAGRVSMMFVDMTAALPQVKAGQLRALATTTKDRSALFPDLPSMKEAGIDLFDLSAWTGIFAPKGTSPEIVAKVSNALHQVMDEPAVRVSLANIGFEAKWTGSSDFAKRTADDLDLWVKLTREAGIERQ